MRLQNKVALVIGASRGSGKQIALELAQEGADIAVAARTERPDQSEVSGTITETAKEITALGRRAQPIRVDLAVRQDIVDMHRKTVETFGGLDILVHSVQYMGPGYVSPFMDTTVDQLEAQLKVNLFSAMHATQLVVPTMIKRGGGTIILISSGAAWYESGNPPGQGSTGLGYPVTKAGLNRFVSAVAKELKPHNIAIIAVDPGFTLAEHVREGTTDGKYMGWDVKFAHGVEVPGKAVRHLCSVADRMANTGKLIVAEDYAKEHGLVKSSGNYNFTGVA